MDMYKRTAEDIQHPSCSWIMWLYLLFGVADDDGGAHPPAVCAGGGAPTQPGGSTHPTGGRKEEEEKRRQTWTDGQYGHWESSSNERRRTESLHHKLRAGVCLVLVQKIQSSFQITFWACLRPTTLCKAYFNTLWRRPRCFQNYNDAGCWVTFTGSQRSVGQS